jgi:hypothetical protein
MLLAADYDSGQKIDTDTILGRDNDRSRDQIDLEKEYIMEKLQKLKDYEEA